MITYIALVRIFFFILTIIFTFLVVANTRAMLNADSKSYTAHKLRLSRILYLTLAIVFFAVHFALYLPKHALDTRVTPVYDRPTVSTEILPTQPRTETLEGFRPLKQD